MPVTDLLIRIVIAFATLLILTRIMGRKEISQMTFFNFISAISVGTIGASLAVDSSLSVRNGLIALGLWSAFTIILGFLNIKSRPVRYAITGQPVILIRQGKIVDKALRDARLDIDSLNTLLRKKNVFSASDVDYAIFETDGSLSVLKKEPKLPATKSDMNVQHVQTTFPISLPVISDGKINSHNLQELQLDEKWLDQQLKASGVQSVQDVFYAEVQKGGTLYIAGKQG